MHLNKNHTISRRALAMLLTLTLCFSLVPSAFAAQQNSYHDPAEHWMQASNRTNELDVNSVVTRETFKCGECGKVTSFEVFRVPEYTRNGQTALSRNVKYSDGTMMDGVGKGDCMDGVPGKDAYYTGYHYTKAVCETCGGINTNEPKSDYGYLKNVYWLFDCAAEFTQKLEETVTYEYTDDTYHTVTTKGGTYCAFCYGTNHTVNRTLERHSMETEVLPQPANGRFATVEKCSLCDYASYDYTAAKAVIADYYGVVDGQPHTITVSDLSEAGVRTSIRYGNSAESCAMTSAPNYTEEGQYTVYYEITYTYQNVSMTENGVANVWLRDTQTSEDGKCTCGCDDPNCGCQNKHCNGNCCSDKGCGENHHFILLDSTKAGCATLGYDRYLCTGCGKIEKRDYVDSLGHAWQSIVIRDATCETDGKLLELCSRCGQMKQTATPKGEHQYKTYPVAATCTNPGYTVRECSVCGDRHIEDITSVLPHNYESHVIAATCEGGGKTIHRCDGCGSSFVTDYTAPLGHSWDEGTLITNATCTGEGVMEYRCVRCGYHRIEGNEAAGHIPGNPATCTEPQLCTRCGAVLKNALGHDYTSEVTAPTCTEMGYTTNTCTRCGDSNKSDYTEPTGHKPGDWIIDKEPTTDSEGSKHKECENCGETLETAEIDKIYNSGTTDSRGEAIVGGYLVTVTDTDTKDPVANAAVTLHKDNSISIRLPNSRLLDYADQTTVTVQLVKDTPAPATVPLTVEKGPFIVITGHDLHDLKLLLEQTEGKGVNIYTHGEMLPAHGYPELKKYPHLKGNFGTAWQNQQREFAGIPAPVLFTTNCLMPPKASYADRVFTTAVVSYPELTHIGEDKDFTPVIEKALELGVADQVIEAVKSGAIRHFFLVGGCDGARPGRNYYTEFVKQTPADTVVLTLACGKYRFNDLDLGTIGGLPRLMDVGQCNDAYGAVKIALALAEAFGCGVNDLPLSMVLSWYEQKAVCILLTLLYLGIKNIRLGPTLPAFVSPDVLNYLVENFGIAPITTPEEDLKQLLK